jgi:hypothetical protein
MVVFSAHAAPARVHKAVALNSARSVVVIGILPKQRLSISSLNE